MPSLPLQRFDGPFRRRAGDVRASIIPWRPRDASLHLFYEDVLAILSGTLLTALGLVFCDWAEITAGGTAGAALVLHFATGLHFWVIFILVNVPFFWLAASRIGKGFALRTIAAVLLTAAFTRIFSFALTVSHIDGFFAASVGGLLIGTGIFMLFRHRTGLGGFNILTFYLQDRFGISAGFAQIVIDLVVLASASFVLSPLNVLLSGMTSIVANSFIAVNHRPGRYLGVTSLGSL